MALSVPKKLLSVSKHVINFFFKGKSITFITRMSTIYILISINWPKFLPDTVFLTGHHYLPPTFLTFIETLSLLLVFGSSSVHCDFFTLVKVQHCHGFSCQECSQEFTKKIELNQHLKTHCLEKPHQCGHCDMKFSLREHLDMHLKEHDTGLSDCCSMCSEKNVLEIVIEKFRSLLNEIKNHKFIYWLINFIYVLSHYF